MRRHMRIILNLSFVIFLSQLNPPPPYTPHPTPPSLTLEWTHTHVHTYTYTHSLTQQEADSRRSERDLTMTLQCYTPTPSSSVEVTAQPADVLSVNYTDNTQLPIVSAAVHRFGWCEQDIYVFKYSHKHIWKMNKNAWTQIRKFLLTFCILNQVKPAHTKTHLVIH